MSPRTDLCDTFAIVYNIILTLHSLHYKRQYLYQNIRPFVREEFKDIIIPDQSIMIMNKIFQIKLINC